MQKIDIQIGGDRKFNDANTTEYRSVHPVVCKTHHNRPGDRPTRAQKFITVGRPYRSGTTIQSLEAKTVGKCERQLFASQALDLSNSCLRHNGLLETLLRCKLRVRSTMEPLR